MSYSDKNKIFFGLLHYIFSEQSNVNWAFKTSLINYTGINESINQRKYKNESISNDIIKYVKSVKPYHVQFDHYIENYTPKNDEVKSIVSDSIFPEIDIRYDSVSVKPDIEDYLYTEGTIIDNKLSFDYSNLEDGAKYYNYNDKAIYRLETINNKKEWVYDSTPVEGCLYFFKKDDAVKIYESRYIYDYRQNILDMYDLTTKQKQEFENTTMANRLFLYKTHDLEEIKDYLNAHFKGMTVKDTQFNINRFGYDAFLYDLKLYEEPTKTILYCLSNYDFETCFPIDVGTNVIKLNYEEILDKDDITNFKIDGNDILDYSIDNNIITMFNYISNNQKIDITVKGENLQYIATSFKTSNDEDFEREFKNVNDIKYKRFRTYDDKGKVISEKDAPELNCYVFDLPKSYTIENEIKVYLEKPNGYRKLIENFVDYNIKNKELIIPVENIKINSDNPNDKSNWKVYITTINDALIYDKVYKWEDIYGIANNKSAWEYYYKNMGLIQNLSDTPFLDPHYNENRPSELTATYPQNSLFVYISKPNETENDIFEVNKIFNFDFKNSQSYSNIKKTTTLAFDFKENDKEIIALEDIFDEPIKDNINNIIIPGKIIINSEMIEYNEKNIDENNNVILKGLKRGVNGTFLNNGKENNTTIRAGTTIYPYRNIKDEDYNLTPSYYYIRSFNQTEFPINGNIQLKKLVEVYKTSNITLLSDIDENTSSFIISDNSIQLPIYKNNILFKKGYLFINGDKIEFESISSNNDGTYTISNFNMINNKKYSYGTQIPSKEFKKLSKNEYKIYTEKYKELKDTNNGNNYNYITLTSKPNIGECIIIENHNKNVFN